MIVFAHTSQSFLMSQDPNIRMLSTPTLELEERFVIHLTLNNKSKAYKSQVLGLYDFMHVKQ